MKRKGNLFPRIIEFENLRLAAKKALRGKKGNSPVARFYFDLEKELLGIQEELKSKTYKPRPLRNFIITDPKERMIGASDFRDRVVHHAICNVLDPILERRFIYHSYACRKRKGTHRAIRQAQFYTRKFRFYLKMDIRKYFESIDHEILKRILNRNFKDGALSWLLAVIINSPGGGTSDKGIPIGNLTSQYFANLYLDMLDHFLKDELGVKGYLRYMDDFILFSDKKSELHQHHSRIIEFLRRELKLEEKERATIIAPVSQGLSFLGFRIFPNLIRIRQENKKRLLKKMKSRTHEFHQELISEDKLAQSLRSITEHLKTGNTHHFRRSIFKEMFP